MSKGEVGRRVKGEVTQLTIDIISKVDWLTWSAILHNLGLIPSLPLFVSGSGGSRE